MSTTTFTDADIAYIRANYLTLAELCADRTETLEQVQVLIEEGLLPRPSYVLDDGTGMFPADYFRLVDEAGGGEGWERTSPRAIAPPARPRARTRTSSGRTGTPTSAAPTALAYAR